MVLSMYGMHGEKIDSIIMYESGRNEGGGGGVEERINDTLIRLRGGSMVVWELILKMEFCD